MLPYIVDVVKRSDVEALVKAHYLHRWPGVVTGVLGLREKDCERYLGVIVFALPPRETSKRYGVTVAWELARLFIEDKTPKNTETWFVARAIAYVKRVHPEVELLVSYADPSAGHSGTIYRAGNWIADGRTDQERKTPRFDYAVGQKIYSRRSHVPAGSIITRVPRVSKFRFVYWMTGHEAKRSGKRR